VSIRPGFSDLLASSETGAQRKKMISTMVPLGRFGTLNRRGRCCPIPMEKAMTTTAYAAVDSHCVRLYGLTQHQIKQQISSNSDVPVDGMMLWRK
jgi:hypothetical protein